MSYNHVALLEPLLIAVCACKRAAVFVDSRVLICGAGILWPIAMVMK